MRALRTAWVVRAGLAFVVAVAAFLLGRLHARSEGAPTTETLAIEGMLLDGAGLPLPGLWNMTLRVFDPDSDGGVAMRTCDFPGTTVAADGRFVIPMNAGTPCVEVFRTSRQTSIALTANNGRSSTVTTTRTRVHAVPYAMEADRASVALSANRVAGAQHVWGWILTDESVPVGSAPSWHGNGVAAVTHTGPGHWRVDFTSPFRSAAYGSGALNADQSLHVSFTTTSTASIDLVVSRISAWSDAGASWSAVSSGRTETSFFITGDPTP